MRSLFTTTLLGALALGLFALTPSDAEARWGRWRTTAYSSYYPQARSYYMPGNLSYSYPQARSYYMPGNLSYYYPQASYYSSYASPYTYGLPYRSGFSLSDSAVPTYFGYPGYTGFRPFGFGNVTPMFWR